MHKPKSAVKHDVVVVGDWDADGATSSAMMLYAQEYKGLYPLRGRHEVYAVPSGPRGFNDVISEVLECACPDALVVLDIPLTERVYEALERFSSLCPNCRLVYVDHHYSTLHWASKLYKLTDEVYLGHKPTAILTFNLLRSLGLKKLTPRLHAFINAVGVLERSGRASSSEDKVVKLAASISKASTVLRDRGLWQRLVRWLASPLPEEVPVDLKAVERALRVAEETDRRIEELARDLAPTAKRVGFVKVVYLREWSGRGASALASKLYKILRNPVALLVERDDGVKLLILRSRGSKAYRMAVGLVKKGLAENIGGHSSLAVIRLKHTATIADVEQALRRLSFEVERIALKRRKGK